MPSRQLTPKEQAAADAAQAAAAEQARADALAREQAGALKPAAAPASAAKAGSYDVLHGMVGEWPQGTEVGADELAAANVDAVQIRRLLDIGAIAPHTDKE